MEKEMQIHSSILAWKMDRGAWQATVHGVARAYTHTHTHTHTLYSPWGCVRVHTHTHPLKTILLGIPWQSSG